MDSNTVEQFSVSYLKLAIAKCEHLNPLIDSNDKTLSWDGYIELYNHGGNKKANFIGKCPIQVKGKTFAKKDFKSKTVSYSVDAYDLKNYLTDGGVIYFVVGISGTNSEKYQIYFNSLLPFDIHRIFQKKDGQKTYSIHLEKFPKECNQIEEIFQDFLFHSRQQTGKPFLGNLNLMQSTEKATYSILTKSIPEIFDGKPKYIYKNLPHDVLVPVEKITLEKINVANASFDVMIDDKVYFRNVEISLTKGNIVSGVVLNEGLRIKVNKKNDTATVKSTKKCTIPQYLKNLEFLIALSTGRTLKIGTFAIGTNPKMKDDLSRLKSELNIYQKIECLFERLNINKKLKVEEISDSMFKKIDFLFRAVIEEQTFEVKNAESAMGTFAVGSLKLFMLRIRNDEDKIVYKNPFEMNNAKCEMSMGEGCDRFKSSLFVKFIEKDFLKYDNLDYVAMTEAVISVQYSDLYGEAVNSFILNLLSAYDKEKNMDMLDCAISVATWLYKNSNSEVNLINKMQSIYRKRILTESERESMIEIQDSKSDEPEIVICCSILLGEKDRYDYCLKKLSKVRRKNFLKYPISHLMK